MRSPAAALMLLSLLALTAQDAPRERRIPPPIPATRPAQGGPVLTGDDGKPVAGVSLARADINAVINGTLAETTLVLTFANANDRVLGGEIVFPLPEGATVTGYGLDVNGVMVDGVAVEKQKARVIYEKEMNKSVDPGLVEHVAGNNFRTRLYPIPARGTRTVKIQYVAPLAAEGGKGGLSLPTQWGDDLREASVRVEMRNSDTPPRLTVDGGEQNVEKIDKGVAVQMNVPVAELKRGLSVVLPPLPDRSVAIEKRMLPGGFQHRPDDPTAREFERFEHYFVIHDTPPMLRREPTRRGDAHIAILWDASLSRADSDKHRELKLLESILTTARVATADVVVFRNQPEAPFLFDVKNGGTAKLIERLRNVTYDGATSLGTLPLPKTRMGFGGGGFGGPVFDYDYLLLFTDGLGNLGPEAPKAADVPVYAVSNDDQANPALLRVLCQQSGGAYWNLKNVADEQVLAGVGEPPYALVSAEFKEGEVAEVFPAAGTAVQRRFTASGRLLVPEAKVTLNYGFGKQVTHKETFTLKSGDAAVGTLVPRFWAQQKVAELSLFADRNADELAKVGKAFNLVTPNTSLLVLETADQYVQHRVVPPKSRPEVFREFLAKIEQHKAQEVATKEQKTQQVLAMWQQRVKWWETEFKYPADLKVVAKAEGADRGGAARVRAPALPGGAAPDGPVATGRPATRQPGQQAERPPAADPTPADPASPAPAPPARRPVAAGEPLSESAAVGVRLGDTDGDTQAGRGDGRGRATDGRLLRTGESRDGGEREAIVQLRERMRQLPPQGREDEVQRLKKQLDDLTRAADPGIEIKSWDPNTPYLQAMKAVTNDKAYGVYLEQRKQFRKSPAFYLDCADYLVKAGQREMGIRVLTNVAELQLEDARLLRVAAHRLNQIGERELAIDLFEKVLKLRPEEPQSHRDLALALADRADQIVAGADKATWQRDLMLSKVKSDYGRALDLLNKVITSNWDRFQEIEVIALMEANQIMANLSRMPEIGEVPNPIDPRLRKSLDLDVRVVMTWDADMTDVDLWVTEPSGEKCFYSHNRTTIGGLVSHDFTQGYGPEEYCLRKLMPGEYKIQANFYGSRQQELTGPCTVQATVITNFGRPDEKRQALTLRLSSAKEVVDIGTVKLGAVTGIPQK